MKTLSESLNEAVAIQLHKADLPKYQLERAIDPFLSPFLVEFVSLYYGGVPTSLLSAEFPIRKSLVGEDGTYQTTNVDYAYLVLTAEGPLVTFIELKTDPVSHRADQLNSYRELLTHTFSELHQGILDVHSKTRRKDKYKHLLEQINHGLEGASLRQPSDIKRLELIYLSPSFKGIQNNQYSNDGISFVDFEQFIELLEHKTSHPELWAAVKPLFQLISKRC